MYDIKLARKNSQQKLGSIKHQLLPQLERKFDDAIEKASEEGYSEVQVELFDRNVYPMPNVLDATKSAYNEISRIYMKEGYLFSVDDYSMVTIRW